MTRQGRAGLKRHLRQAVTRDDVIWRLDDLMLRFALMDGIAGRGATLCFLRHLAVELDAYVTHLRRYLEGAKASVPATGRLALENGIEGYAMHAAWARRALAELESNP